MKIKLLGLTLLLSLGSFCSSLEPDEDKSAFERYKETAWKVSRHPLMAQVIIPLAVDATVGKVVSLGVSAVGTAGTTVGAKVGSRIPAFAKNGYKGVKEKAETIPGAASFKTGFEAIKTGFHTLFNVPNVAVVSGMLANRAIEGDFSPLTGALLVGKLFATWVRKSNDDLRKKIDQHNTDLTTAIREVNTNVETVAEMSQDLLGRIPAGAPAEVPGEFE